MTADLQVLTFQQVIGAREWELLQRDPAHLDSYIKNNARQHIAAEIAEKRLARETLCEPDPESQDPMRQTNAVLTLSVAVAASDDAALLARELAEAENRGYQRAISDINTNIEKFAPYLGDTAYVRGAMDRLVEFVVSRWNHRPAADWRPMRTCPGEGRVEYLFLTGDIRRSPRLTVPIFPEVRTLLHPQPLAIASDVVKHEEFDAVAWRHAGRPAHVEQAA